MFQDLGLKEEVPDFDQLYEPLDPYVFPGSVRPNFTPQAVLGHPVDEIVCCCDQRLIPGKERLVRCKDLHDMQEIYDWYAAGNALALTWYVSRQRIVSVELQPYKQPETAKRGQLVKALLIAAVVVALLFVMFWKFG